MLRIRYTGAIIYLNDTITKEVTQLNDIIEIGSVLKNYRLSFDLTLEQLANNLNNIYPDENFTKGKISKWERNSETPKVTSLKRVADYFGTSIDDILTASGLTSDIIAEIKSTSEKLTEDRRLKVLNFAKSELTEQNTLIKEPNDTYTVRVCEKVAAGTGYPYCCEAPTEYHTNRSDLRDYDFATLVDGDSMEPKFMDGDVVLVKSGYDNVNGDVYVIDYNGKSYVKKLYNDGDRFRLVSINKKYDNIIIDIPIDGDIYFNIVGKVVDSFTPIK